MISLPSLYSPGNIDKLLWGAAYLVAMLGIAGASGAPRMGNLDKGSMSKTMPSARRQA